VHQTYTGKCKLAGFVSEQKHDSMVCQSWLTIAPGDLAELLLLLLLPLPLPLLLL
jgi:hypothetical protein